MSSCIWNTPVKDRHCEYCTRVGCSERPSNRDFRAKECLVAMEKVLGEDLTVKRKTRDLCWARFLVAYQMTTEGYLQEEIASVLNISRPTVSYAVSQAMNMFHSPKMYPREMETWHEYENLLNSQKL